MLILILCAEDVGMLRFYTQDSNIFAGIASSVTCICSLIAYRRGETRIPYAARLLQYVSACCLAVTFTVVVLILIPMNGGRNAIYPMLFEGAVLYMHFLCPILSVIITVFFTDREGFTERSALWGLLLTLVYGFVTVLLNILGVMEGPYPFLRVRSQSVQMSVLWLVLIIGGAYGIASVQAIADALTLALLPQGIVDGGAVKRVQGGGQTLHIGTAHGAPAQHGGQKGVEGCGGSIQPGDEVCR